MMRILHIVLLVLMLVACGEAAPTAAPTATPPNIQAVLAASALAIGPNRLPIGLLLDGTPINEPNAKVHMRFFYLGGSEADKTAVAGESDASYFGTNLPAGVYVTYPEFPKAGPWGVEIETTLPDGRTGTSRLRLDVLETDPTPPLGSQAIAVDTPTVASGPLEEITSDPDPNPALYQTSLKDALAAQKPIAVMFGTPGFCKTAVCGPSVMVLGDLQRQFGDRITFIHVEVYQYPFSESFQASPPKLSQGMTAWGLQSEPWLFLIDSNGTIRMKYEGGITTEELTPVLNDLLLQEAQ